MNEEGVKEQPLGLPGSAKQLTTNKKVADRQDNFIQLQTVTTTAYLSRQSVHGEQYSPPFLVQP